MKATHRLILPSILVFLFFESAVPRCVADVFHVSPRGNDKNPGTADKPFRTIPRAVRSTLGSEEPGEIIIHQGLYPGGITVGTSKDQKGGPRPLLLVRAAEKEASGRFEEVIIDGGRTVEEAEAVPGAPGVYRVPIRFNKFRQPGFWELDTRQRYIRAADFAGVKRFPASFWCNEKEAFFHTSDNQSPSEHQVGASLYANGITLWRPNVTVRGLKFRNCLSWRWSAGVELRAPDTAAEECEVTNSFRGYQLMIAGRGMRVVRCRAEDVAGGFYSHGLHAVVEDCVFLKKRDPFMVPSYPQDDCGIQFYYPASEGEVRRNLVVGFGSGIFVKCPTSEFIVEHNTCLDGLVHGIGCTSWHPKTIFRYNIVTGYVWPLLNPWAIKPTNIVDYNCLWAGLEDSALRKCLEGPRKVGTGTHNIYADPRFAAPSAGDYCLLPDSPCAKLGRDGQACGAFGVVSNAYQDIQPPRVKLFAAPPAVPAGGSGELYFERDPWLGGGRNLIRKLPPEIGVAWVTPNPEVTVLLEAQDNVSRPVRMQYKIGQADWSPEEAFQRAKKIKLPEDRKMTGVAVRVSDEAGNTSPPAVLLFRLALRGPQLVRPPVLYTSRNGVVISFETDSACLASVEFGEDPLYGTTFRQPRGVQRSWLASDGGDWVEIRSRPKVTNFLVLVPPKVQPGKTFHYRLRLSDEVENETVTGDATFTLKGAPKTWFVGVNGKDEDTGGTKERPWKTIQFAVDRALPGDRVQVGPGLFPGETYVSHGGLPGAPITIEAEKEGASILDGRKEVKACIRLERAPHVVIRGFETRWFQRAGIYAADSPDLTVSHCKAWNDAWFTWPVGSGIFAHRSPGFTGDHNVIFAIEQGITLLESPNSRILHNTILKNMYGAVKFIYSAANTVSRNNSFCFSGNDQYLVIYQKKEEFESFDSDYNNLGTKLRKPGPDDAIKPEEYLFKHSGSKAVISLNRKRYNSLSAWQKATGKDLHSIFRHPQYIDPAHYNFHLKPTSPNIGAGEDGATIGAFGATTK